METNLNLPTKKEIVNNAPVTELQHKLYMTTIIQWNEYIVLNKKPVIDIESGIRAKRKFAESIGRYTENSYRKNWIRTKRLVLNLNLYTNCGLF